MSFSPVILLRINVNPTLCLHHWQADTIGLGHRFFKSCGHLSFTVHAPWIYSCCHNAVHFPQHQILLLLHHTRARAKKYNYWFICTTVRRKTNDSVLLSTLGLLMSLDEFIFYLHPFRDNQLLLQSKKEDNYSRGIEKKKKINFCLYLEFEGEKKGMVQMEQSFPPFYLMPQSQVGLVCKSSTYTIIS